MVILKNHRNRKLIIGLVVTSVIICATIDSCTTRQLLGQKRLTTDEASSYLVPVSSSYSKQRFWIIKPNQVEKLRRSETATYLGSDSNFHYFTTWNKIGYEDEIYHFAISKNICEVKDEKTIDETIGEANRQGYRHLEIIENKCNVDTRLNSKE